MPANRNMPVLILAIALCTSAVAETDQTTESDAAGALGQLDGGEGEGTPDVEAASDPEGLDVWNREQLTGNWWGTRSALEDAGISFEPYVIIDWSKNTRGGLDTEGSAFRHVLSLNATADLTQLLGWDSGSVFVDFHNQHGAMGSDEVGDYQFVGNWDSDGLTQVSELWFEYELDEGTYRIKVGKVDANWEFAYSELGWEFVQGSASYPATNFLMPTYPDPAMGLNLLYYPDDHLSVGFGIYDGSMQEGIRPGSNGPSALFGPPADLYLIDEVGLNWHVTDSSLPGRVAVGGWFHTGSFVVFDDPNSDPRSGTGGFYLVIDQLLWREQAPEGTEGDFYDQGIGFFFQYDYADPDVMWADHHVGAGLTWRGLLPGRDDDLVGVGLHWLHFTDEPFAGYTDTDDAETAYEAFYKAQVTPAMSVQPYIQVIEQPGGVGLDTAVNVVNVGSKVQRPPG